VIDRLVFWVSAFSIATLAKVFLAYSGILFNMASWIFFLPTRVWVLALIGLLFAVALIRGFIVGPRAAVLWLSVDWAFLGFLASGRPAFLSGTGTPS